MSKQNAARRNRALRKIRKSKHVDLEIKSAIEVILDLLNGQSDYNVAWPSAATIAARLKRSRRTGQWYVKTIKELGIFECIQLPPPKAVAYCESRFGFRPKLDRCNQHGPNLYVVNPQHPLWNESKSLPDEVDLHMGEVIQRIKAMRNAKSTSRFASDPTKQPRQIADSIPKRVYCLATIRERLRETIERLGNEFASDEVLSDEGNCKWCREEVLNDVANDTVNGVANDIQVFKLSSVAADALIAPPPESFKAVANPSVIESLKGLPSGSPVRVHDANQTTPPTHHSAGDQAQQSQTGKIIARTSAGRSAAMEFVGIGCAAPTNFAGTDSCGYQKFSQGRQHFDLELIYTMERLEGERNEKLRRLAANAANRLDVAREELSESLLR
mgnify:CR=1 FL=1